MAGEKSSNSVEPWSVSFLLARSVAAQQHNVLVLGIVDRKAANSD